MSDAPRKLVRKIVKGKTLRGVEQGYRKTRGIVWRTRYGFPARKMKVIAVTGTNGKTTTCSYISEVLKAGGYSVAIYTTAYYEVDGVQSPNRSHMTVAGQADVQKFFARARRAGVDFVVIEATSIALDQHRLDGVPVEVSVMTNLTQDHLDYHKTMERYAAAKALLFGPRFRPKFSILNADDTWYDYYKNHALGTIFSYGKTPGSTLELSACYITTKGSNFSVRIGEKTLHFHTTLVGEFNVYNALAAIGVGQSLGLDVTDIGQGIANLKVVPGRMEPVNAGQPFLVLVDYAYTPDALLQVLTALRLTTKGKVRIVFGATGDRDKEKRPLMGEVVAKHADVIYLTDDETYTENPAAIRSAVFHGIDRAGGAEKTQVFDDRKKAIEQAFEDAAARDVVLLAGLGHQDYRNMGGKKMPWDEREIARQLLKD